MGSDRPRVWASGSLAARCAISRLHKPVTVWSIRAGFLPLAIHHRDSGTRPGKNRTSPTVLRSRVSFFSSGSFHRSSSVEKKKIPISVLPSKLPNGSQLNLRVRAALRWLFERLLCANNGGGGGGWGGRKNNNRGDSQSGPRLSPL